MWCETLELLDEAHSAGPKRTIWSSVVVYTTLLEFIGRFILQEISPTFLGVAAHS